MTSEKNTNIIIFYKTRKDLTLIYNIPDVTLVAGWFESSIETCYEDEKRKQRFLFFFTWLYMGREFQFIKNMFTKQPSSRFRYDS